MNLTVLGPRVFIRPEKLPEMTADGSLHLVHDRQNSTMIGTVVALGDGPRNVYDAVTGVLEGLAYTFNQAGSERAAKRTLEALDEFESDHVVKAGDRVLFSPDRGQELIFERDLLICLLEDDVLAVIE